ASRRTYIAGPLASRSQYRGHTQRCRIMTDGHAAMGGRRGMLPRRLRFFGYCLRVHTRLFALLLAATTACGGPGGPSSPAADGVHAYIDALRSNDPHDAYKMMSATAKKKLSFDEFALQWKQTKEEREWQAKALEASLKGNPDVGERARFSYQ